MAHTPIFIHRKTERQNLINKATLLLKAYPTSKNIKDILEEPLHALSWDTDERNIKIRIQSLQSALFKAKREAIEIEKIQQLEKAAKALPTHIEAGKLAIAKIVDTLNETPSDSDKAYIQEVINNFTQALIESNQDNLVKYSQDLEKIWDSIHNRPQIQPN